MLQLAEVQGQLAAAHSAGKVLSTVPLVECVRAGLATAHDDTDKRVLAFNTQL